MRDTDNIAAATGGILGAVFSSITTAEIVEVVVFAFLGGFVGVFAKNIGTSIWTFLCEKLKKRNSERM